MAAKSVIAERRHKVVAKLDGIKARLSREFGVTVEEQPVTNRDPELAQVQQLENVAVVLEGAMSAIATTVSPDEPPVADAEEADADPSANLLDPILIGTGTETKNCHSEANITRT